MIRMIRVLHIEDDAAIAAFTSRLLKKKIEGVEVVSVASGEAAVEHLRGTNWSLVISDWDIKGKMSGGDVFEAASASGGGPKCKWVFMSDNESAERMANEAGVPYIQKPANVADIMRVVTQLLDA